MQKDDNYADMYEHDSDFDHVFFYIFNSIAMVLAAGATNTHSAWVTLKNNENETIHGMYCFNVKAAVKSIVRQEPAIEYSDPILDPMPWEYTNTAALLQLLQSYI
jgi:hypothetical protein